MIPAALAAEVARDALEQEIREQFIYEQVEGGASVFEVYPMNEETERRYRSWRQGVDEDVLG